VSILEADHTPVTRMPHQLEAPPSELNHSSWAHDTANVAPEPVVQVAPM
jgi:hypothetical protein